MPILAAPLQSLGVIGTRSALPSVTIAQILTPPLGFVLLGIPVYYVTQKNEDIPRVFGAYGKSGLNRLRLTKRTSVPLADFVGRFRSRPDVGSGWQAIATEEEVEMVQSRR